MAPCGGVWPCKPLKEYISPDWHCFFCHKWEDKDGKLPDHHCEEWDAMLHGGCVEEFLKTDDGKLVIDHNHLIQIYDDVLQQEGGDPPEAEWGDL